MLEPFIVLTFNKERIMPRSGAEQSLTSKKVMLVGCGSVGGDIADKLAASGVGHIDLYDPDTLSLNNLYRHILPPQYVSFHKPMHYGTVSPANTHGSRLEATLVSYLI
jgi:hypothetical protein